MKFITIYIAHNYTVGADDDTYYTFSESDAENRSTDIRAHLTAKELESRDIYTEGYEIRIPDDYTVTTAEQLVRDLSNGDVESPDYDELTGQFTSRQTYYSDADEGNESDTRYLPTDEHWNTVFTNIAPYCLTREEAEKLLNEWHGPYGADDGMEFDELWREASADEIAEYGTGE